MFFFHFFSYKINFLICFFRTKRKTVDHFRERMKTKMLIQYNANILATMTTKHYHLNPAEYESNFVITSPFVNKLSFLSQLK
jgi:hypothetical protein